MSPTVTTVKTVTKKYMYSIHYIRQHYLNLQLRMLVRLFSTFLCYFKLGHTVYCNSLPHKQIIRNRIWN